MKPTKRFAIIDDNGIVFESNDEDEIRDKFYVHGNYDFEFKGDLLFVEILDRTR